MSGWLNSRLDTEEEKIRELEDWSEKIMKTTAQRYKEMENTKKVKDMKKRVPEGKNRQNREEAMFKDVMAEN